MIKKINFFINRLINIDYKIKFIILFLYDFCIYIFSIIFSILFFTFNKGFLINSYLIFILISLFFLIFYSALFNIYKSFIRYGEFRNLLNTFLYIMFSFTSISFAIFFLMQEIYIVFLKVNFLSHLLIFTLAISSRILIFVMIKINQSNNSRDKIIVYGAGFAGSQIVENKNYNVLAFLDNDDNKIGRTLNNIKIFKPEKFDSLIKKLKPDFLLIAIPSLDSNQRKFFINKFINYNIPVKILPSAFDIFIGKNKLNEINNFELSDFIERKISWNRTKIQKFLIDKTVLITGAGGSIGSELSRQIILCKPKIVILLDHSEFNLFKVNNEIENILKLKKIDTKVVNSLGSIKDFGFLNSVFKSYNPAIVFHAAAYKHVTILENNIIESVKTNIIGTKNLLECSFQNSVEHFHYISTDKAVNPKSIMGASKRFSEILVNYYYKKKNLKSIVVRFGNVLNSDGSVLPIFKEQIEKGGPVTLTDTRVTRYFMSIKEAVGLVLESAHLSKGGEFYVLNMGEPVKIIDILKKMIKIYGLTQKINGKGDIEVKILGLRKGEKINEEVNYGTNKELSENKDILYDDADNIINENYLDQYDSLEKAVIENNTDKIQTIFEKYTNYVS